MENILRNKFETVRDTSKELEPVSSNNHIDIIPKEVDMSMFSQFAMDKEKRTNLKNIKYLYNGLFVKGYHTFLYGSAGAGKTTVMLHICLEIAKKGYRVVYFYLDGNMQTSALASEKIEKLQLENNFKILTDGTSQDYKTMLEEFISSNMNLDGWVFVLDTYKYFNTNVNDKGANARELQFIKKLQILGASFISLGHTNKDGVNQSGTAEIEQDTDALLRIDSINNDNKFTSTIKRGGRCRFDVIEQSFSFMGGGIDVEPLDKVIDVAEQSKKKEELEKDQYIINEVRAVLRSKGRLSQKELVSELKETDSFDTGTNKTIKILKKYVDKFWSVSKIGDRNKTNEYMIIES